MSLYDIHFKVIGQGYEFRVRLPHVPVKGQVVKWTWDSLIFTGSIAHVVYDLTSPTDLTFEVGIDFIHDQHGNPIKEQRPRGASTNDPDGHQDVSQE